MRQAHQILLLFNMSNVYGVNHQRFNKFAITAADFFCEPDRIAFSAKIRVFFGIAFSVSSLQINSPGFAGMDSADACTTGIVSRYVKRYWNNCCRNWAPRQPHARTYLHVCTCERVLCIVLCYVYVYIIFTVKIRRICARLAAIPIVILDRSSKVKCANWFIVSHCEFDATLQILIAFLKVHNRRFLPFESCDQMLCILRKKYLVFLTVIEC